MLSFVYIWWIINEFKNDPKREISFVQLTATVTSVVKILTVLNPFNQSINQSIDQSVNDLINQSTLYLYMFRLKAK